MKYETGISLNCVCGIGGVCHNCKREQEQRVRHETSLLLMDSDTLTPEQARHKVLLANGWL